MTKEIFLQDYKKMTKEEVLAFVKEHQEEDLPSGVLGRIFEKLYVQPDGTTGYDIELSELVRLHHSFTLGNGAGWSRADDGSYLGKKYRVINHKEAGRIVAISTEGYKPDDYIPKSRKIAISTLAVLADAAETYKILSAALISGIENEKTRTEVIKARDDAEMKVLHIIDEITKGVDY